MELQHDVNVFVINLLMKKILKRYALFAKMNFSYHQIKTGGCSVINAVHITLITIIKD